MKREIELEKLRNQISYDPITGHLYRKNKKTGVFYLKSSGSINSKGYVRINFNGINYAAHRIAWTLFYGDWPNHIIDHINRIRSDNRISNLRAADFHENRINCIKKYNNKTGITGVSWHKASSKWIAQIQFRGKKKYLGLFENIDDAKCSYRKAATEMFGEYWGERNE